MDISRIQEYWKNKPREETARAFESAMFWATVVELLLVVGVYFLLKAWVFQFIADCWIIGAYALVLKNASALMAKKLENDFLENVYGKEDSKESEKEAAKAIE